jgi:hypothetical protein
MDVSVYWVLVRLSLTDQGQSCLIDGDDALCHVVIVQIAVYSQ